MVNKNYVVIHGILYAVASSFIFSIMNAFVKLAAGTIPANEIVFFRSSIGTIIILCFMIKGKIKLSKNGVPMLALRGCCGALYMIFYFYALANMPLIDAIILANTSPLFSILFSRLFLKEKNPLSVYIVMPLVLSGVMFTVKPFGYSSFSVTALFGILAALFSGAAGICIRHLGQKYHTYEIIFYFMATATVVSIPLMWNEFIVPQQQEWFYLICIGVVSLIAQIFLTKAFTHENAVIVEIVRYIGIAFNAAWGFIFWTEIPDFYSILGMVMIIGGCILMTKLRKLSGG
ncbi:MAG: DMT family transporter [Bacteroidales bacterium]|jgi:drug/metabolite transporter (DMT)-like permease|nr:DMT family transporter [Bacteroidales bacterium]